MISVYLNYRQLSSCTKFSTTTYSTVTDFARFLGISTLVPLIKAQWYANNCNGIVNNIGATGFIGASISNTWDISSLLKPAFLSANI